MDTWFFRAGEGEGSEEEEWLPTSVIPLSVQVGSLTATSPTAINGHRTTFIYFTYCRRTKLESNK